MIPLILYVVALFFLGIGSTAATYHVLRYRDPHDISVAVLVVYYILFLVILIGTTFFIDWSAAFANL